MSHHWGYVAAVISAILFGVSSTLNKLTLEDVNPTVVAGLIYFVAGVLLFAFHLTPLCNKLLTKLDTSETETTITHKDYRTLAFVIICGSIIAPLLLLNGLNQTTAINSSLLLNAEALFTVVIAYIFLKERCAKKEYIGIVMLLVGVIFVTTNWSFSESNTNRESDRQFADNRCLFLLGHRQQLKQTSKQKTRHSPGNRLEVFHRRVSFACLIFLAWLQLQHSNKCRSIHICLLEHLALLFQYCFSFLHYER